MRKTLGLAAIVAGVSGFFGARATFEASASDIMISLFILLCSLLSIGLGVVAWRATGPIKNYIPLLFTAAVAGAVSGSTLLALILS